MTDQAPPPVQLGSLTTSYYEIFSALQQSLIGDESWNNLARSGTGTSILRFIASVGELNQGAIARAIQEVSSFETALSPSAVFRLANLCGINVIRARPGYVNASVFRSDGLTSPLTIPARTQWTVGEQQFFNRDPITLPQNGANTDIVLYRGTLTYESFSHDGRVFRKFLVGSRLRWEISADDLWVIDVNNRLWAPVTTGLWSEKSTSYTFNQRTMPDGRVECLFGDGTYGSLLPAGDLTVGYAALDPASTTVESPVVGASVGAQNYAVRGVTTSIASSNQDAPSPTFYKKLGTGGASNRGRAVTRADHRAVALEYDGVIDAVFRAQAEMNPSDIRYMNVFFVTLLTTATWTEFEWLRFKRFIEADRTMATCVLVRSDPIAVPLTNMTINVKVFPEADLTAVQQSVFNAVIDFFAPQMGSLGGSYSPSDLIVECIKSATWQPAPNETRTFIDFVEVPRDPIDLSAVQYFTLSPENLIVNVEFTKRRSSSARLSDIVGM